MKNTNPLFRRPFHKVYLQDIYMHTIREHMSYFMQSNFNRNTPSPGEADPWGNRIRGFPSRAKLILELGRLQKIALLCPDQNSSWGNMKSFLCSGFTIWSCSRNSFFRSTCPLSPSFFSLLPLWKPGRLESTRKREIPCAAWFYMMLLCTVFFRYNFKPNILVEKQPSHQL